MSRRRGAEAGFTLVEVILALFIGSLVMLGSYSVTSQIIALSEDVRASLAAEDALDVARMALANDLASVIWVETQHGDAGDLMAFRGGRQETALSGQDEELLLSLASAASLDPGAPFPSHAFNRVEYVLRRPPEKRGKSKEKLETLQLVRREIPVSTLAWRSGRERSARETVLFEAVSACAVAFFEGGAARDSWDSRERRKERRAPLPAQVRLQGAAVFGPKLRVFDLRAALSPMTYAGGERR